MPFERLVGSVYAVPVALPRPDTGNVAVEIGTTATRQLQAGLPAVGVEEAQLDPLGGLGEDGKVGAPVVDVSSDGPGRTSFDSLQRVRNRPSPWRFLGNEPTARVQRRQ